MSRIRSACSPSLACQRPGKGCFRLLQIATGEFKAFMLMVLQDLKIENRSVEGILGVLPILACTEEMAGSSRAHDRRIPHLHAACLNCGR